MIPTEAILKEDFDRVEKGLPPVAKPKIIREEPERPTVPDEIKFADIPEDEIFEFSARGHTFKNEAGTRFTGYNIYLETRKGKAIEAWMPEGEFHKLRLRIQVEAPHLLLNIGL